MAILLWDYSSVMLVLFMIFPALVIGSVFGFLGARGERPRMGMTFGSLNALLFILLVTFIITVGAQ
ncbi:MAG: hypothetical protein Q7R81_07305 [Candidatus Peregrinibacteria bacterium]|nr:hypothetical protein [Candidatus Peregrinibacteria bacterium]